MQTERLIEKCILRLEADIQSLQEALDTGPSGFARQLPFSAHIAEALLRRKRLMLASFRDQRRRPPAACADAPVIFHGVR